MVAWRIAGGPWCDLVLRWWADLVSLSTKVVPNRTLVGILEGSEGSDCAAAIAISGRGLCTTWSVAYVGLRVNCDLCGPVLVLLFHAGVALWRKLGSFVSVLCNNGLL
ncbi:hypothetical protein V6N12_065677 [Hibiscus sabdariffa]|uniref:Uncharacterized protein n=1 Tax=Hibiscus sabdariffa TaxID=183260 RepID=A0ABR2G9I1_9ROSI